MIRGNDGVYNLALLEDDACLSLFARHALGAENVDAHPNLKVVGEKLVEKCKRLPLALKTLGGLLRGKLRHDQWENLLNSEIWDLREDNSDILPALRLSYNHLPSYLKRCFGYCALFPKDYEFEEGELVLLWMAEGLFQQQPYRMKQMKDLGHRYFRDLVSRAFFQQSSRDESLFVMHDLMRDLALYVTGKTCCTIELEGNKLDVISQEARHLSFFPCVYEVSKRFDILKKPNSLRTFLRLKTEDDYHSDYYLSNVLFQDLLQNLKWLRVLSLDKYQVRKLVDSIGDLQHLRYINLSCTLIESLPDSIGFLIYLQTLLLRDCAMLSKLPRTMGNLHDLQHFDITETPSLEEMPLEINNLTNLVTLPKFIIGNGRGLRVKDLKNLSRLQGQLSILNLENVSDARDAREANLYEIKGLDDLSLEWSFDHLNSQNDSNQVQVVSWLKPHEGLKRLKINCFGGLELPSWIGHPSFFNLKFLELRNCQRSTSLPSLGQLPQLKELIITGMHAIEIMTLDFDGDTFSSIEAFQSLESMELQDCPMLVGKLPKCLLSLKRLKIAKCPKLMYSLTSLPSLEELYIEACSEVVLRSMVNLTSLKTLRISRISYLTCLPRSFVESMILLEDMEVKECNELTCLWEEGAILNLACLKRMTVINCPLVVSLTMKKQGLLPDSIQTLEIHNCPALESLPTEVMMMVQLEDLHISGCLSLNCFPSGHLPTSLKCLSISNCTKLEFIHERMLQYCRELKGMSVGGGMNMKSLPFLRYMHGLTFLWIDNCEGLESFPERGMSMSIPNLRRLWVENCINLKYLPNRMHDLTLLDELIIISNSPGIEAIPDGGLPRNLTWLTIDCKNLKQPVQEWGLCELTSLLYCEIHWICPPDDILSNSITTLVVKNVENLKSISGDLLKNMNSLQNLFLEHWPKLRSLPNESLPPLQKLYIVD